MGLARFEERAIDHALIPGPLGDVLVSADGDGLSGLSFLDGGSRPDVDPHENSHLGAMERLLYLYWRGEAVSFDVPLSLRGTRFQLSVWHALLDVPYGETITYAELARRVGSPRAVRAVGRANGANPISIVVPCHRVIGSNGSLTGYGGGIERKRALLDLEMPS